MVFAFLGTPEIIIILVIALLVFGPQKLPEIGKQVGSAMRELNKVRNDVQKALELDEFTNLNFDSNSHNTYDSYDSSHANTALPAYESPQGVTHAAVSSDYNAHYAHYGVDELGGESMGGFVAPPGPKGASPVITTAVDSSAPTESHSDQQGTV